MHRTHHLGAGPTGQNDNRRKLSNGDLPTLPRIWPGMCAKARCYVSRAGVQLIGIHRLDIVQQVFFRKTSAGYRRRLFAIVATFRPAVGS